MKRDDAGARAVAAAAEWRLIGLLFERPRQGWRAEVEALADEVGDDRLAAAAREAAAAATEGKYQRLLGPGGLVSPREVSYRPMADPGSILAALSALYEAFAFHPRAEDPIDHTAVEAGFVGYLFLKEAYARSGGDDEAAQRTATVRESFLENHLAAFGAPFVQRLEAAGPSFLVACARLLSARLPEHAGSETAAAGAGPLAGCSFCGPSDQTR